MQAPCGISVSSQQQLKRHPTFAQEAIMRNIEACKKLSDITRTSLGPNGMNKLVRGQWMCLQWCY